MVSDPRIGSVGENGIRNWPETDAYGQPYTRPANVVGLGKKHFAVFGVNGISDEKRAELLAIVQPAPEEPSEGQEPSAPAKVKSK